MDQRRYLCLSVISPGFWGIILAVLLLDSGTPEARPGTMIDVASHGAIPDDGEDDTLAVLAALEACRSVQAATLSFPPGRYDFHEGANPHDRRTSFPIRGMDHLTIEGAGAEKTGVEGTHVQGAGTKGAGPEVSSTELIFHGLTAPFHFRNCRDLTVRGLTIDWERPPFSVGRVISATPGKFDALLLDEFPVDATMPVGAFDNYDPETGRIHAEMVDVYWWSIAGTEFLRPQVLRVKTIHPVEMPVGDDVVLRHHVYDRNAFTLHRCENVRFEDVTIYTCPGMGIYAEDGGDYTLDRVRILIRPGKKRLMSTTADAVHFSGCRGLITLNDCVFEGMGDDGGNFGFLYLTVEERVSENTVLAKHNLNIPNLPTPGDRIEFTRRDTLIPYATGTVRSATTVPGAATHEIEFERPLPAGFQTGDLLANVSRAPRVRIRGCTVRGNRARGFLIPARDAIVEDCLFENTTGSGIAVMPESVFFFEGVGARDLTIRNNRFINCAYTTGPAVEGAVAVFAFFKDFTFPRVPGLHRDIAIEGNVIRGSRNSGIFIAGVDGLVLRDNTIMRACENPTRPEGHAAVYMMGSANVKTTGNRIDPESQGAGFKTAWKIGPGCDEKTIVLDETQSNAEN